MLSRFLMPCAARLLALVAALASVPLLAQPGHGAHQVAAEAVAVAPAAVATPSKPAARMPRPQLGIGAAFAPDGSLWIVGLTAQGQLFVQSAASDAGSGSPQWRASRVVPDRSSGSSAPSVSAPCSACSSSARPGWPSPVSGACGGCAVGDANKAARPTPRHQYRSPRRR